LTDETRGKVVSDLHDLLVI